MVVLGLMVLAVHLKVSYDRFHVCSRYSTLLWTLFFFISLEYSILLVLSGLVEAERSAVSAMFDVVRTELHMFPAEYSLVQIAEKRVLYNTMRVSMNNMRRTYAEMELPINQVVSAMLGVCRVLSAYLARRQSILGSDAVTAVSGFHAIMHHKAKEVALGIKHASSMVDMLERGDNAPDEQIRFDQTVPMPQVRFVKQITYYYKIFSTSVYRFCVFAYSWFTNCRRLHGRGHTTPYAAYMVWQ